LQLFGRNIINGWSNDEHPRAYKHAKNHAKGDEKLALLAHLLLLWLSGSINGFLGHDAPQAGGLNQRL
jgi:hypothetical protein